MLDGHTRWRRIPDHPLIQPTEVVADHSGRWLDRAAPIDRDVDRWVAGSTTAGTVHHSDRGPVAQRGGFEREYGSPGALQPRERPGVVDVDAVVDRRPLSSAEQPSDVVRLQTSGQRLPTRDHAGLELDHVAQFHVRSVGRIGSGRHCRRARLWTTRCAPDPGHQVARIRGTKPRGVSQRVAHPSSSPAPSRRSLRDLLRNHHRQPLGSRQRRPMGAIQLWSRVVGQDSTGTRSFWPA